MPSLISSITSCGGFPSTVQPTDCAVPKTSLTVPAKFLAIDLGLICLAMLRISSNEILPLCLMFFCFFLSRGGSFRALMIREAAEGTTEIVACLFWILSCTVILRPFQSAVPFAISSPTFFGDCNKNYRHKNTKTVNIILILVNRKNYLQL